MWQAAQTIFLSIVLESLPFVLLGVILSSLIQEFVSRERMLRMLPKNKGLAVVASSFLGFLVPVCDCGTIPMARSLMRKGVPVSAAMSFVLAAPVVNPMTMLATFVAFGMNPTMMWARTAAAFGVAVSIGWVLLLLESRKAIQTPLRPEELTVLELASTGTMPAKRSIKQVTGSVIQHAIAEFFEIMGFVVLSATVAALLQTFVPSSALAPVGEHPVFSVLAMMGLAILFSLCSAADGFVARSLAGLTTNGGVLGFLVIGQMIDIRNLFLFPRIFPKRVIMITFFMAFVLTLFAGIWVNVK
ncbi:permease [Effusibacillus consociatus]|uniref:Permease n=1 Tax=Effusibacillus consociatus TaxID=1117041 RepID=A0ABV9Q0S1_9BACL